MEIKASGLTGLKKRQQIQSANKTVFLWVTIASALVVIALVLAQFLIKESLYRNKVIGKMMGTNSTLQKNVESYTLLKGEVNKLLLNPELSRLRVEQDDVALQTIIDAMPTSLDRVALATSLQQSVLSRSGVTVESLSTNANNGGVEVEGTVAEGVEGAIEIPFTLRVSGSYDQMKKLFEDINNSIRPISVKQIQMTGIGDKMQADISAITYYAEPKTTALKDEEVQP